MPGAERQLRQRCTPVDFDAWAKGELGKTILLMLDAMYGADGIGLAAPQVGIAQRLIVVDPTHERHQAKVLINPEVWWQSERRVLGPEGCLSVPGEWGMVERPYRIKVRYQGEDGLTRELAADDLLARVILHEVDHLDGVLFTDKRVQ